MQLVQVDIGTAWPLAQNFPTFADLISSLLPRVLLLGGIIFFLIIVITGFGIIAGAGGDPQAVEGRKNILTYAAVGFIIMFGAYWILQIINFITGGSLRDILSS